MSNAVDHVLTFGGTIVGYRLHGIGTPNIRLVTEPKVIHPFWWKEVLIDGRYGAASYEYPFGVILSKDNPSEYLGDFHDLAWMIDKANNAPTTAKTVCICEIATITTYGTPFAGNVVMSFGPCFFTGASQQEPNDVMVTSFGIVEVKFLGASRPTLVS